MMVTTRRRWQGMTLIEVLVAVALFAIFTVTITQLLMGGMRTYRRGQVISTLRNDLKTALEVVSADVRSATEFNSSLVKGSKTLKLAMRCTKQTDTSNTSTEEVEVSYEIDATTGVLKRSYGATGSSVSTIIARNLVAATTDSPSYFLLVTDASATDDAHPFYQVETRLTASRFVGTDEQRMSMVSRAVAVSGDHSTYVAGNVIDFIPVNTVKVTDLLHPMRRSFVR